MGLDGEKNEKNFGFFPDFFPTFDTLYYIAHTVKSFKK